MGFADAPMPSLGLKPGFFFHADLTFLGLHSITDFELSSNGVTISINVTGTEAGQVGRRDEAVGAGTAACIALPLANHNGAASASTI
jgi:hypothetical protein